MRSAQPFKLAVLQDAQQLRLQFERQLADLVEKQSAAMSQLKASDALRQRAGERASFVPEQFTFEQPRGDRRAVQFHERAMRAAAQLMDRSRHQFLAGAGFALDQHGGIGGRGRFDLLQHAAQRSAGPDDFIEAILAADLFLQINLFVLDALAKLADFFKHQRVLHRDGDLAGDVIEQRPVLRIVGVRQF